MNINEGKILSLWGNLHEVYLIYISEIEICYFLKMIFFSFLEMGFLCEGLFEVFYFSLILFSGKNYSLLPFYSSGELLEGRVSAFEIVSNESLLFSFKFSSYFLL